ncbi:MAG TPA: phosphatase PAP2 family protein [Tissierellaceae bacterium]|nr:phosphatase PAP2 family protein [Tissierellaceae bacterium]
MRNVLKRFDNYLIELINHRMKNKFLDKFMYRVTDLGGAIFSSVFALVLVFFGNDFIKLIGVEALLVLGLSQIVVQSLKLILSRQRPYKIIEQLHTFGINLKDYSFPSGHTTASFSIATVIALNIPIAALFTFFLATIIGISRIYLGVHYPTDVAAGILLGVGTSLLVHIYLLEHVDEFARLIGLN